MPSKFIKNSRINNSPKSFDTPTPKENVWYSMASPKEDIEEKKQMEEYRQKMKSEKVRIEAIPLEQLSFKDIYTEPFEDMMGMGRIYSGDDFAFQFLAGGEETKQKCLQILNGEIKEYKRQNITHKNGEISVDGHPFILIRNWGGLTGTGGYNLDERWASKIQDSLEEYIVEKLTK